MKQNLLRKTLLAGFALATFVTTTAQANQGTDHIIHIPADLKWQAGPPALPPGAEFTVLEGDPGEEGIVTFRIRFPAGYQIPPHTHPAVERVTILEGEFKLGQGRDFDEESLMTLPQGSFFAMPPGMAHFAKIDVDTVIELVVEGRGKSTTSIPTTIRGLRQTDSRLNRILLPFLSSG